MYGTSGVTIIAWYAVRTHEPLLCVRFPTPGGGLLFTFGLNSSGQLGHSPGAHSVAVSRLPCPHVTLTTVDHTRRLAVGQLGAACVCHVSPSNWMPGNALCIACTAPMPPCMHRFHTAVGMASYPYTRSMRYLHPRVQDPGNVLLPEPVTAVATGDAHTLCLTGGCLGGWGEDGGEQGSVTADVAKRQTVQSACVERGGEKRGAGQPFDSCAPQMSAGTCHSTSCAPQVGGGSSQSTSYALRTCPRERWSSPIDMLAGHLCVTSAQKAARCGRLAPTRGDNWGWARTWRQRRQPLRRAACGPVADATASKTAGRRGGRMQCGGPAWWRR